jgi:hypothetical protein
MTRMWTSQWGPELTKVIFAVQEMSDLHTMENKGKIIKQSDAVYGLGMIGALVYFIQHATSFGMGLLGVLKALFWPAYLVYKALEFLKL